MWNLKLLQGYAESPSAIFRLKTGTNIQFNTKQS